MRYLFTGLSFVTLVASVPAFAADHSAVIIQNGTGSTATISQLPASGNTAKIAQDANSGASLTGTIDQNSSLKVSSANITQYTQSGARMTAAVQINDDVSRDSNEATNSIASIVQMDGGQDPNRVIVSGNFWQSRDFYAAHGWSLPAQTGHSSADISITDSSGIEQTASIVQVANGNAEGTLNEGYSYGAHFSDIHASLRAYIELTPSESGGTGFRDQAAEIVQIGARDTAITLIGDLTGGTSVIGQEGEGLFARTDLISGQGLEASVSQVEASFSSAWIEIFGNNNSAFIRQTGDYNGAHILSTNGYRGGSSATVEQNGSFNLASVVDEGYGTDLIIHQTGGNNTSHYAGNTSAVTLTARISQTGDENTAEMNVFAAMYGYAEITQTGDGNTATLNIGVE